MVDKELLLAISDLMDQKLEPLQNDIKSLMAKVESLEARMGSLEAKVESLEADIQILKQKTSSLEVTLETETNRDIRIIAEGHLDLTRKLDEALKVENEKEILLLRVSHLESELRKLKEKLGLAPAYI